jgi:hypothetical protein
VRQCAWQCPTVSGADSVSPAGEGLRRGLVKRVSAFHGRKPSGKDDDSMNVASVGNCPTCLLYCTGLCTGLLSYVSIGSKVRNRQLVVLNCPTRTDLYTLLYVGSGLLSKRDKVRTGLCGNVRNCRVPLPQYNSIA